MVEKQVEVKLKTGLQARPAALRAAGAGQQPRAGAGHRHRHRLCEGRSVG